MNRIILIGILASILAGPPSQAEPLQAEATFSYRNSFSPETQTRLKIRDVEVTIDGRKLDAASVLRKTQFISAALSLALEQPPLSECTAGYYIHKVKKNKKVRTERGCISDSRFGVLNLAFYELSRSGK